MYVNKIYLSILDTRRFISIYLVQKYIKSSYSGKQILDIFLLFYNIPNRKEYEIIKY